MGTEPGKNFARLMDDMQKNAASYSVFYAIYLCETLLKKMHPEHAGTRLEQQGLSLQPHPHYGYAARNIRDFRYEDGIMKFVINLMGLYGNDSPLPRCYHEQVSLQQNIHGAGEVPLQNFLDIFNDRFYWHYYQAWKKYRFYLQLNEDPQNAVLQKVFAFIGQGPMANKAELPVSRYRLLQLSGVLSHRVRSKSGLLIVLREFFPNFQIDLIEFVLSMVEVDERPQLGRQYEDQAFQLGANGLVGRSVVDYMSRVCLEIGPLDFDDYLEFLPGGKNALMLNQLLNLYLNDGLEYDIKLTLKTDGIGKVPWSDKRIRLGRSCWLGKPKKKHVEVYLNYEKYSKAS